MDSSSASNADSKTTPLADVVHRFLNEFGPTTQIKLHLALFYGEIHTLQNHQHRLTNQDYYRHARNPYCDGLATLLETDTDIRGVYSSDTELVEYSTTRTVESQGDREDVINEVALIADGYTVPELKAFADQTWVVRNTETTTTPLDFDTYQNKRMVSEEVWRGLEESERTPVPDETTLNDLINQCQTGPTDSTRTTETT